MQRRHIANKQYERLAQEDVDSSTREEADNIEKGELPDLQFETEPLKTPWGTIFFAGFLFIVGTLCLTFSAAILLGYLHERYDDRAVPAFIIGIIMFIPGAYYMKVTLCVILKFDGYSYDDIPQFN